MGWQLSFYQGFVKVCFYGKYLCKFLREKSIAQIICLFSYDFKERQNHTVRSETGVIIKCYLMIEEIFW